MTVGSEDPKEKISESLEPGQNRFNKIPPSDRTKITLAGAFVLCALGFPLLSSSSLCSSRTAYETAKEIYSRFSPIGSIENAREIGNDPEYSTAICRATLILPNGERRTIKYTVRDSGDGSIWVQAQAAGWE